MYKLNCKCPILGCGSNLFSRSDNLLNASLHEIKKEMSRKVVLHTSPELLDLKSCVSSKACQLLKIEMRTEVCQTTRLSENTFTVIDNTGRYTVDTDVIGYNCSSRCKMTLLSRHLIN